MEREPAVGGEEGGRLEQPLSGRGRILLVLLLAVAGLLWVAAAARHLSLGRSTPQAIRGLDRQAPQ